ncbi:hypothetical protein SAMN05421541_108195 [Actinoplanes philippinensis]|uniref:Uncharacterized protein n=2 Tax=Actinoplanes philippinensis TaxID=35752 RepID=A0A1I2HIC3_9ACTN|nr:hypothetical protein SAMN05421541_108195 [Actinoplanes philippinensis]
MARGLSRGMSRRFEAGWAWENEWVDLAKSVVDYSCVSEDEAFVVAAFVAAHRWLPPTSFRAAHLPAEVVSVSECLTDFHPHAQQSMHTHPWHLSLDDALHAARDTVDCAADVPPEHVIKRILRRITSPAVEHAVAQGAVHTLAMSVPTSDAAALLTLVKKCMGDFPGPFQVNLAMGAAPPMGQALGFEVLGFDESQFHTWLCYGWHIAAADRLDVLPAAQGLLSTLAEARLVADMANQERESPEECWWFPALITQHDVLL